MIFFPFFPLAHLALQNVNKDQKTKNEKWDERNITNQKYSKISGAKGDGMSTTNPSKVCADRIQFQLTLHKEEEEENQNFH